MPKSFLDAMAEGQDETAEDKASHGWGSILSALYQDRPVPNLSSLADTVMDRAKGKTGILYGPPQPNGYKTPEEDEYYKQIVEGVGNAVSGIKPVGKAKAALDMSKAARMARAEKMGFDTGKTYYHGTKADIQSFDPNALGASTNAGSAKQGFFFASEPSLASDYSRAAPSRAELSASPLRKKVDELEGKIQSAALKNASSIEMKSLTDELVEAQSKLNSAEDALFSEAPSVEKLELKMMNLKGNSPEQYKKSVEQWTKSIDYVKKILSGEVVEKYPRPREYLERKLAEYKDFLKVAKERSTKAYAKQHAADVKKLESEIESAKQYRKMGDSVEANVLPVHLKYENPLVHDFNGDPYRDVKYAELMDKAKKKGHDAVIFKNTYDPAFSGPGANYDVDPQDIIAVFDPSQIRSVNAAFDPKKKKSADILAGFGAAGAGLGAMDDEEEKKHEFDLVQNYLKGGL